MPPDTYCPVCGKMRSSVGTYNLAASQPSSIIQPSVLNPLPGGYSHIIADPDLCYSTGECAPKWCPTCGWCIPAGQEHDCAKLAGITGKPGMISRQALMEKYQALLIQTRQDVEAIEHDYQYSIDEDGQPHAPRLTEVTNALKKAIDEVARLVWD